MARKLPVRWWIARRISGAAILLLRQAAGLTPKPADIWADTARIAADGLAAAERAGKPPANPLKQADWLREQDRPAEAADAYRAAVERWPDRTDLRKQLANMLKDAGQPVLAEIEYRQVLAQTPDDADASLQLGHALKLQGRREASLAAYRRAAALDPNSAHAQHELADAGSLPEQAAQSEAHWRSGGAAATLGMLQEIAELRAQLDRMASMLPDAATAAAFPISLWDRLRRLHDVPPPPDAASADGLCIVLMAIDTPIALLQRQLAAFAGQAAAGWQLVVAVADPAARRAVLLAASTDGRVRLAELQPGEDAGLAELRLATESRCKICVLLAPGALPDRQAAGWFHAAFAAHPGAVAFVCDEDRVTETALGPRWSDPQLRQAVDYDTLLEANVYGGTIAVKTGLLEALAPRTPRQAPAERRAALLLELSRVGPVGHIPLPLISLPLGQGDAAYDHAAVAAAHLAGRGDAPVVADGRVTWREAQPPEAIAVVILTRNNAADAVAFVSSLLSEAELPQSVRLTIVDNGSDAANQAILSRVSYLSAVRFLRQDGPFNWAALNNAALAEIEAPIVVFCNDDMRMLSKGWDTVLRGLLARPDIGAVGAKLLYEDGAIQHGGVVFGWRDAPTQHDGLHRDGAQAGPGRRWQVTRCVAAVTGAFLATRLEHVRRVGGFDAAALPVGYSDIDFALRLRSIGLRILWTPQIRLEHAESKTRGPDLADPAQEARSRMERAAMEQRWGDILAYDPSVNPYYHPASLPFQLVAAPAPGRVARHVASSVLSNPWACRAPAGASS